MYWYSILLLFTLQQSAYGTAVYRDSLCPHDPGRSCLDTSESHTEEDNTNSNLNFVNNLNIHITYSMNGKDQGSVELTGTTNKTTFKCPAGYELKEDHCEDVDECELSGNKSLCSENAKCINTAGSYECRCHEGFMHDPFNNKVCLLQVVNAPTCPKYPNAGCEYKCESFPGGYWCVCPKGYGLMPNGKSCEVFDKCSSVVCDDGFTCANTYDGVSCIDLKCPQYFFLDDEKNLQYLRGTWHRCSKSNSVDNNLDFNIVPKYYYWYELINVASMETIDDSKPLKTWLTSYYNEGRRWSVNSNTLSIKVNGSDSDYITLETEGNSLDLYLLKPIKGPQVVEFEATIRDSPTVIDTIFYFQLVISEYKFRSMEFDRR